MPEPNKSRPNLSEERVGEISFLLTKWAVNQLSPERLARAVGITTEDMLKYQATINGEVDTKTLFHGMSCPHCVIGIVKYQDKMQAEAEPHAWTVLLKCSNCQTQFTRENS